MRPIKMVDLHGQYLRIQPEIDKAIQNVLKATDFIQGGAVREFESALSDYLGAQVISCGNGTDALQIAMMALDFKPGDEVILPVHTYVATAEVIALLQLVPVFVDVDENFFTVNVSKLETLITKRTVAIVPVHLYGQCADLKPILDIAKKHRLHVIEDAAQSLGADYLFAEGSRKKAGTVGLIGTTSFFPSKNLGAFGDGGALITSDEELAEKIRMIANHGQRKKYQHDVIGVNSRLDTLQAAILQVKLKQLDHYAQSRREVAAYYDTHLKECEFLTTPIRATYSTHVFHQYTVRVNGIERDLLKNYLQERGIPSMIYYPIPLHLQEAYRKPGFGEGSFEVTERLSRCVLSLPIHTEMDEDQLSYICNSIKNFS
ncbi:MAG: DegT/DnrJ/EryC1/StrS family aminotransferase [Cytophagales bacterium]|nr:DegT/DnrJ/EryC1/StrS family aminotransferase [Cytophagales bacterium]